MTVNINGFDINYERFGEGRDVLILHGWGYDISLLERFAHALSDSFCVTLADMPGHGHTAEPEEPMTVYDYALLVRGLIEKLKLEHVCIIGHSFGCRLAIILASKYPALVDKMLLCGAAGIRPERKAGYYIKTYKYKLAKFFIKTFAPKKLDSWQQGKGSDDYRKLSPVMKATFSNIVNEDLTPLLCGISCPVFLVWGENDTATPLYMADIMEREIPDCAKVVYKGRTHYAFLEEAPRTVAIAKTFFRE